MSTPLAYDAGGESYPVLYVLDGRENIVTAVAAARALASAGRIPDMIIVGVVNAARERDLTPVLRRTTSLPPGIARSGGADAFLGYLGDELVPYVDSRFRTRPLRIVAGHSLGGLLAMYALAVRPTLFRRYVALDPSLWWDDLSVADLVRDSLNARPSQTARIAVVRNDSGPDDEMMRMQPSARTGLSLLRVTITGESHESMVYRGMYDGLAALFDDYAPKMRHDQTFAALPALRAQYSRLSRDFGYDVPIPLYSLLEVANRESNQRRFIAANAALASADSLYPGAVPIASFRADVDASIAEARRLGQCESRSRIEFTPVTRAQAASLVGEWRMRITVTPGTPGVGSARFELRGDTLIVQMTAEGVALDGGILKIAPAIVAVRRNTLRWDRENNGGGRAETLARLTQSGRIEGSETIVDGHPLPPGFTPPTVHVVLTRVVKPRGRL